MIPHADSLVGSPTLSTYELADHTGLTYRQIDYWCRTEPELFEPRPVEGMGQGTQRRFDARHIARFERAALLIRAVGQFTGGSDFTVAVEQLARFVRDTEDVPAPWVLVLSPNATLTIIP